MKKMDVFESAKKIIIQETVNLVINSSDKNLIRATTIAEKFTSDIKYKKAIKRLNGIVKEKDIGYQIIRGLQKDLSKESQKKLIGNLLVNGFILSNKIRVEKEKELGFLPPLLMVIDVTDRCNLKCPGCWAANCNEKEDISIELLDRIMKEAKDMGIYFITIAGGEPFIRKDIVDFFAKHNEMFFQVYTNGTCITEDLAKRLGEIGNVAPAISVEGLKEETEQRRGIGTYDRVSKSMEWLKKYGVLFGFSAMVTKNNSELIGSDKFIDHWLEKGCKFGWFFQYIPIGRCPDIDIMSTPEQRVKLRRDVERIRKNKPIFIGDFWNDGHYVGGCMAGGKKYLHITNNGSVEPCVFAHFYVDNIKEKSLIDILKSDFFTAIRKAHPYSNNKNLLMPCMIIDHPEILRSITKKFGAKGTHDEEMQILSDEKTIKHLNDYSKRMRELTDKEWEGEYHDWYDFWFKEGS